MNIKMKQIKDLVINDVVFVATGDSHSYEMRHVWELENTRHELDEYLEIKFRDNHGNSKFHKFNWVEQRNYVMVLASNEGEQE